VWENMGWHYSAISPCERIKVHPCKISALTTSYTAFLGETDSTGGVFTASACKPRLAVALVIREGQRALRHLGAMVSSLAYNGRRFAVIEEP
jgi:hypothetical protein